MGEIRFDSELETALTSKRDNTSALKQHNLHAFQTAHPQCDDDGDHCFAVVIVLNYI